MEERSEGQGEARPARTLLLVALGFSLITVPIAAVKQLTNDEIYVRTVASLPRVLDIWRALARGADNLPPLDYALRHAVMLWAGPSVLSFRLVSLGAVLGAVLVLARIVHRRLGTLSSWSASILFMLVAGYAQSFQARGYPLLLLFFVLLLYGWDLRERGQRGRAFLWIVFALGGATYSHYYGVFFVVPVVTASALEWWRTRRFPLDVCLAIGLWGILCLPLVSLVGAASRFSRHFWTPVTLTAALSFYSSLLEPVLPCLLVGAIFLAIVAGISASEPRASDIPPWSAGTLAFLGGAALIPFPLFVVAKVATGAFQPKYALAAGVAVCLLAVGFTARLRIGTYYRAAAIVALPALCLAVQVSREVHGFVLQKDRAAFALALAAFQDSIVEPVVIGDDGLFVELSYSDRLGALRGCYFVYDANPRERTNVDEAIWGLSQVMPLRVSPYAEWRRAHTSYVVVGTDRPTPLIARAVRDGAEVTLRRDPATEIDYWRVEGSP